MDVVKIMVMATVGAVLAMVLKEQKQSMGVLLGAVCALLIFFMGLPYLDKIVSYVKVLYSTFGGADGYMGTLLKITGIAALSTLAANICSDAGMSAISGVVLFSGKIICMFLTLPVIGEFFKELINILP